MGFFEKFRRSDRKVITALVCVAAFSAGMMIGLDVGQKDSKTTRKETKDSYTRGVSPQGVFDPNTADSATLTAFGLEPWKARNLIRYRTAGAVFRTPNSLLRVYGMNENDVERLSPHMSIGERYRQETRRRERTEKNWRRDNRRWTEKRQTADSADSLSTRRYAPAKFTTLTKVNPNTADTTTLCSIPGVGKKISESIIRYRTKLGGFHDVRQLAEINIVSPELLEWFKIENNDSVSKININKDSFQRLNSHPYISYDQTRDLLQYRRLYGAIKDVSQLRGTGIFTDEETERLVPYIIF